MLSKTKRQVWLQALMNIQGNAHDPGWEKIEPVQAIMKKLTEFCTRFCDGGEGGDVPLESELKAVQAMVDALPEAMRDDLLAGEPAGPWLEQAANESTANAPAEPQPLDLAKRVAEIADAVTTLESKASPADAEVYGQAEKHLRMAFDGLWKMAGQGEFERERE